MRCNFLIIPMLFALASVCEAQQYELGAIAGFGTAFGLSAENASGESADTGIGSGVALGIVFTDNLYGRFAGEVHYLYRSGELRVESGGEKATLSARSHLFHYDFVVHDKPPGEGRRFFAAAGVGGRIFQGKGIEKAFQPLSQFVLLTKTSEAKVLLSVGGGVKWTRENGLSLRMEIRDNFSPAPNEVLFPSPGGRVRGWLHDIVPQVGIGYSF